MASSLFQQPLQKPTTNQPGPQLNPDMIQRLEQALTLIQGAQDKNFLINSIVQSNPQLQAFLPLINSNNYKEAVIQMAKQQGINPNDIKSIITQFLKQKGMI